MPLLVIGFWVLIAAAAFAIVRGVKSVNIFDSVVSCHGFAVPHM